MAEKKAVAKKTARGAARPKLAVTEKARRAAELKVAGATWRQIAEDLGYANESGARNAVRRYYERAAVDTHEEMYPVLQARAEQMWVKAFRRVSVAEAEQNWELWDKAMRHANQALQYSARINGLLDRGPVVEVNVAATAQLDELRSEFRDILTIDGDVVDQERTEPVPQNVIE